MAEFFVFVVASNTSPTKMSELPILINQIQFIP